MIKDAKPYTLTDILSKKDNDDCLYIIPPYQRAYAWTKTEWEELFNDLLNNEKGYFLGSLICIGKPSEYKVIDGQQRLTTLSILLLSIYENIEILKKEFAGDMSDDNLSDYLWLKKAIFNSNTYRLTPSIQNDNKKDWIYLVDSILVNNLSSDKPSNFGNRRISKSYEFFKNLIRSQIMKFDDETTGDIDKKQAFINLFKFLEKIKSSMLIKIETDDEQSAFLLFESLNNRGVPLSPIDLIKNKILEKMLEKDNSNIENDNKKWQKILLNIGEQPNLQERFLRHFYMSYSDILPVPSKDKDDKIIIPKITKSNLINLYSKQINENVDFIFLNLVNKSKCYGLLINPENINNEKSIDEKYKDKLINLKHLGISSAYMLLSFVFDKYQDRDFTDLLDYLEFWFICRHATNEPATNQLDKIFTDLVQSQKQKYSFEVILSELNKYLDKEKICLALKDTNMYDNSNLVRAIFIRLESNLRNEQTAVDYWKKRSNSNQPFWSIEHIYPQKPKNENDWGNTEQIKQLKERLHSLGNLTLTCYNSSYSNKKYTEKCSVIDENGKEVGLINGDIKINQKLPKPSDTENTWTPKKIDERTDWLIKKFVSFMDKKE